jgi:hypothetical protein
MDGRAISLVWRAARVAAVDEADSLDGLADKLAAKGVNLIVLPRSDPERRAAIAKLAATIEGRTP